MAKAQRTLADWSQSLDIVVEVLDARLPASSGQAPWRHLKTTKAASGISQRLQHKPRLLLLNKADLADPIATTAWVQFLSCASAFSPLGSQAFIVLPFSAHPPATGATRTYGNIPAVLQALRKLGAPLHQKQRAQGRKPAPLRTAVVGMPNVGKSTLINRLIGKKKVVTGHKAGVTREPQWIQIHPEVVLLDTPGLMPAHALDEASALRLASVASVGDKVLDEEDTARFLLATLAARYPARLGQLYGLGEGGDAPPLEALAPILGCLQPGGLPDVSRAARAVLRDFRQGRWGGVSLEWPPEEAPAISG
jgi:ribosome biogenesis GTPase A